MGINGVIAGLLSASITVNWWTLSKLSTPPVIPDNPFHKADICEVITECSPTGGNITNVYQARGDGSSWWIYLFGGLVSLASSCVTSVCSCCCQAGWVRHFLPGRNQGEASVARQEIEPLDTSALAVRGKRSSRPSSAIDASQLDDLRLFR